MYCIFYSSCWVANCPSSKNWIAWFPTTPLFVGHHQTSKIQSLHSWQTHLHPPASLCTSRNGRIHRHLKKVRIQSWQFNSNESKVDPPHLASFDNPAWSQAHQAPPTGRTTTNLVSLPKWESLLRCGLRNEASKGFHQFL